MPRYNPEDYPDITCSCGTVMRKSDPKYKTVTKQNWKRKKHCSRACKYKDSIKDRDSSLPDSKICKECGESFDRPKIFVKTLGEEIPVRDEEWRDREFCQTKCRTRYITVRMSPLTELGKSASYEVRQSQYRNLK